MGRLATYKEFQSASTTVKYSRIDSFNNESLVTAEIDSAQSFRHRRGAGFHLRTPGLRPSPANSRNRAFTWANKPGGMKP